MDEIEVRVNKEINEFREKFYFNLTAKQLISLVIAIIIVVPLYLFLKRFDENIASIIIMCIGGFILALGWYEPLGISFFNYIQVLYRNQKCFKKILTKKSDVIHEYYEEIIVSKPKKEKGEKHGKKERKNRNKEA